MHSILQLGNRAPLLERGALLLRFKRTKASEQMPRRNFHQCLASIRRQFSVYFSLNQPGMTCPTTWPTMCIHERTSSHGCRFVGAIKHVEWATIVERGPMYQTLLQCKAKRLGVVFGHDGGECATQGMKASSRPPGDTSMSLGSTAMPTASAMRPLGATSISCGAMLISVGSTCAAQQSVSVSQERWIPPFDLEAGARFVYHDSKTR